MAEADDIIAEHLDALRAQLEDPSLDHATIANAITALKSLLPQMVEALATIALDGRSPSVQLSAIKFYCDIVGLVNKAKTMQTVATAESMISGFMNMDPASVVSKEPKKIAKRNTGPKYTQ